MASPRVSVWEVDEDFRAPTLYLSQIRDLYPDKVIDIRTNFVMDADLNCSENFVILELIKYYGLTYDEASAMSYNQRLTYQYLYPEKLRIGRQIQSKFFPLANLGYFQSKPGSRFDPETFTDREGHVVVTRSKPSSLLTEGN